MRIAPLYSMLSFELLRLRAAEMQNKRCLTQKKNALCSTAIKKRRFLMFLSARARR